MKTSFVLAIALASVVTAGAVRADDNAPKHPKNTINQLKRARKHNHTTRQVTVDPKKSPGKHVNNLSKNVNHETNRESKDVNHGVNNLSKKINHAFQNH